MNNSDLFLVSRNGISHKVRLDTLKSDVNNPVNQDIADLKQKDVDLDRKIDLLQLDVNQNEVDSDTADAALDARISALEGEPDVDLSGYATKQQLNNEEAARIAGDNSLDSKITNEANARIAGDNTLGNEIDGVEQRVNSLQEQLDALEAGGGTDLSGYATEAYSDSGDNAVRNEFKAADDDLQASINAEKAARIAGDQNLLNRKIIAGDGLSGGGDLDNDIRLDVVAGFGINIGNKVSVDDTVARTNTSQEFIGRQEFSGSLVISNTGQKYDANALRKDEIQALIDASAGSGGGGGGGGEGSDPGYVNVKELGAKGDGSTDDTAVIKSALQAGGGVYFPAGTYRVTSTIAVTNKGLHMFGDSTATRILFDPSTTNDNFLAFNYDNGGYDDGKTYAISNLVIQAKQNKVCGTGVRLEFTGGSTLVGVFNKLTLTNVDIGSEFSSDANTGYFKTALHLLNSAGVVGTNLNIYTNAKTKVEYGDTDSCGIKIQNSLAGHAMIRTLYLNNFYIQRYHTGVRSYSSAGNSYNSIESLYLSQGELLAAKAMRLERISAVTVIGIHSDVRDYFLDGSNNYGDIHYASTIRITGSDIRSNRIDSEDITNEDYLFTIKGQQTIITGNVIMSFKNKKGIFETGGTNHNQINTVISGNHLSGNGNSGFYALRAGTGSRTITYGGNTLEGFGGNENPISNSVGTELFVYGQRAGNS